LTATGITALLAALATLVPTLFVAVTVKVYSVPFDKPETTQDNDVFATIATEHVAPPGCAVAV
jgi:hypothetical protein